MKKFFGGLLFLLGLTSFVQAQVTSISITGIGTGQPGTSLPITFTVTDSGNYSSVHYDVLFSATNAPTTNAYSSFLQGPMQCYGADYGFTFNDRGNRSNTKSLSVTVPYFNYSGYVMVVAIQAPPFIIQCSSAFAVTTFAMPTPTVTSTPTNTATPTNTVTSTFTSTFTNTATSTFTPTATNTPTNTFTPTATFTATSTPTITSTVTNTPTATAGPTQVLSFFNPPNTNIQYDSRGQFTVSPLAFGTSTYSEPGSAFGEGLFINASGFILTDAASHTTNNSLNISPSDVALNGNAELDLASSAGAIVLSATTNVNVAGVTINLVPTANIVDVGNSKITSVASPVTTTDAATKGYVDNLAPKTAFYDAVTFTNAATTPVTHLISGVSSTSFVAFGERGTAVASSYGWTSPGPGTIIYNGTFAGAATVTVVGGK